MSQTSSSRYAIYFMPPGASPLWAFGSAVLGYDAATGQAVPYADPSLADDTAAPRRYGFHATLKAPFHLRNGADEKSILDLAANFAATRQKFQIEPLELRTFGGFVALTNAVPSPCLSRLADDCVMHFDGLRALASDADRARRFKNALPPRQTQNFERWGYPFVMQDFTFHMTLTGALAPARLADVFARLSALYGPVAAPLSMDAIAIYRQARAEERFVVLRRFEFGK